MMKMNDIIEVQKAWIKEMLENEGFSLDVDNEDFNFQTYQNDHTMIFVDYKEKEISVAYPIGDYFLAEILDEEIREQLETFYSLIEEIPEIQLDKVKVSLDYNVKELMPYGVEIKHNYLILSATTPIDGSYLGLLLASGIEDLLFEVIKQLYPKEVEKLLETLDTLYYLTGEILYGDDE